MTTNNENNHSQSPEMKIIMEKVDVIGSDFLKLIETELRNLGIDQTDMISALQFAIVKNMEGKIILPK